MRGAILHHHIDSVTKAHAVAFVLSGDLPDPARHPDRLPHRAWATRAATFRRSYYDRYEGAVCRKR